MSIQNPLLVRPEGEELVRPDRIRNYTKFRCPRTVFVCFEPCMFDVLVAACGASLAPSWIRRDRPVATAVHQGKPVALALAGVGATAVSIVAEELIALGARRLIGIGSAGTISAHVRIADIAVIDEAIRDEGTSYQYLSPGLTIGADSRLLAELRRGELGRCAVPAVRSWTTSSLYMQRRRKANLMRALGASVVELETAGLYAIAKYRRVRAAAAVVITDSCRRRHYSRYRSLAVRRARKRLAARLKNAITAIDGLGDLAPV